MSEQKSEQTGERLSRFLAHAGIASRRHAEELIASGRVQVNGETVTLQGTRIDPDHDHVNVDGKPVHGASRHMYVLLNKPAGYICTAHDPQGRPTVLDLLPQEMHQLRVYPIGRLDIDTSGLLLLTNDGTFALRLTHPRYTKEKHYEVVVRGHLSPTSLNTLRRGMVIMEDDGKPYQTSPAQVRVLRQSGTDSVVALTIHEGRKRQVRRMFKGVGHEVLNLMRVGVGALRLSGVPVGAWRYLTDEEISQLSR